MRNSDVLYLISYWALLIMVLIGDGLFTLQGEFCSGRQAKSQNNTLSESWIKVNKDLFSRSEYNRASIWRLWHGSIHWYHMGPWVLYWEGYYKTMSTKISWGIHLAGGIVWNQAFNFPDWCIGPSCGLIRKLKWTSGAQEEGWPGRLANEIEDWDDCSKD